MNGGVGSPEEALGTTAVVLKVLNSVFFTFGLIFFKEFRGDFPTAHALPLFFGPAARVWLCMSIRASPCAPRPLGTIVPPALIDREKQQALFLQKRRQEAEQDAALNRTEGASQRANNMIRGGGYIHRLTSFSTAVHCFSCAARGEKNDSLPL